MTASKEQNNALFKLLVYARESVIGWRKWIKLGDNFIKIISTTTTTRRELCAQVIWFVP